MTTDDLGFRGDRFPWPMLAPLVLNAVLVAASAGLLFEAHELIEGASVKLATARRLNDNAQRLAENARRLTRPTVGCCPPRLEDLEWFRGAIRRSGLEAP